MVKNLFRIVVYMFIIQALFGLDTAPAQTIKEVKMQTPIIEPWLPLNNFSIIERETIQFKTETVIETNAAEDTTRIQNDKVSTKQEPGNKQRVCILIDDVCSEMLFADTALIKAMVYCESNFNKNSISKYNSQGLMQITPKWFGPLMREYGVTDLCSDEAGNLRIGIHWIQHLITKYDNDIHKALVAYNCGESKVDIQNVYTSSYSQKVLRTVGDFT